MKARFAVAAMLVAAGLAAAGAAEAQTPSTQAPLQPILAGKKFIPPIHGQAEVDFVKGVTKREGTTLVTRIQVKNTNSAPIARLKVTETWYDKSGGTIPGGEGVINGLLQPGEVQTIEIHTPVNLTMQSSNYMFTHANGAIKPHSVKSFDAAKEPAPKAAPAGKKKK
jgi:hypothetical protein